MDLGETIREGFEYVLYNVIDVLLYYIEIAVCRVISWLESLFNVFSGVAEAKYNGKGAYLINIFFGNKIINAVYLGMAVIGFTLAFIFTIISVVKKAFDLDDKVKMSYGQILRSLLRSIIVIVSMNLIITVSVGFTSVLMTSVTDAFRKAPAIAAGPDHIQYTDEQFAAMSRIFNTIGNYSLNPSYKSRYNLNTCYNEIRTDLKYLGDTHVFNYNYLSVDENGKTDYTWQYVLEKIARAADYNSEWPVDKYNDKISNSILDCMECMKTDPSFHALQEFTRDPVEYTEESASLDKLVFLIGTMGMGSSDTSDTTAYTQSPDFYDNVRASYYLGEKSIYNFDQVNEDFDISVTKTNYLVAYFCGAVLLINLATILLNCMVRIFNLLFLYLIAPPIAATMSLDDGGKFRQWTTAFIVQLFSVFATVISMRLFLIYVPIIMSPDLEISSSAIINAIGKMVMIWAGAKAVGKANGILTGILTDNAGMQSLMAGDMSRELRNSSIGRMAQSAREWTEGKIKKGASKVAGTAFDVATLPARPITGAASALGGKIASGWNSLKQGADSAGIKTVKS